MRKFLAGLLAVALVFAPLTARAGGPSFSGDGSIIKAFGGQIVNASAATTGQVLTKQADGTLAFAAAGGGGGSLAATLAIGNITGANSIIVTTGRGIAFNSGAATANSIVFGTGGGSANHILGPTDQTFNIVSNGTTLQLTGAGGDITLNPTGGHSLNLQIASTNLLVLDTNNNVTVGTGSSIATNAVNGFLYTTSCAGTPTGVPAGLPTGSRPLIIDSTNNALYFYSGGWIKSSTGATLAATLTAGNTTGATNIIVSGGQVVQGVDAATGGAYSLRGGNGSAGIGGNISVSGGNGVGSDQSPGNLTISSGNGSGATTGSLAFKVAPTQGSGAGTNTAVTVFSLSSLASGQTGAQAVFFGTGTGSTVPAFVVTNVSGAANVVNNAGVEIMNQADLPIRIVSASATGGNAQIVFNAARGTFAAGTTLVAGDPIGVIAFQGATTSGVINTAVNTNAANITVACEGSISNLNLPSRMTFATTATTALVNRLCIDSAAGFKFNSAMLMGWVASASDPTGALDTNISRNAAGVAQFGTSAANSSGSWLATNGTLATQLSCPLLTSAASAPVNITPGAGAGTNSSPGGCAITTGLGTGLGFAHAKIQTGFTLATGSTAQTLGDRVFVCGKSLVLSNTTATTTTFASLSVSSTIAGQAIGGICYYTISGDDGVGGHYDTTSGSFAFSAINPAGTVTAGTIQATTESQAGNQGTIAGGPTIVASGATLLLKVTPVFTTIAPSVGSVRISWTIIAHGLTTVTPQ